METLEDPPVIPDEDLTLPDENSQSISEQYEKIKKMMEKERLKNELRKRKMLARAGKIRYKSNSMSSVDSKDGPNEINSSLLSGSTSVKTSEVGSEEPPTRIRRSLRTYDKLEDKDLEDYSLQKRKRLRVNNKSDEPSKSKDCKLLNKKPSYQSKELKKNDKVSNVKIQKSKSRNVSESSISSDKSKQPTCFKNNLADLTVSDSSSRSVTPELLRGKISNRSVTSESIGRKSNLHFGDKDLKSKLRLEKACIKFGHHIDLLLPTIKIDPFNPEIHSTTAMGSKSKHLVQNKNEANNKVKAKPRGRGTSDFLVVQQSPDVPLGKRS